VKSFSETPNMCLSDVVGPGGVSRLLCSVAVYAQRMHGRRQPTLNYANMMFTCRRVRSNWFMIIIKYMWYVLQFVILAKAQRIKPSLAS
jgi:hypothetical protein